MPSDVDAGERRDARPRPPGSRPPAATCGHDVADVRLGAPVTTVVRPAAQIDLRHVQRVAPWMRLQARRSRPIVTSRQSLPTWCTLFDFEARHRQALAQLGERHVDLDQLAQPAQRALSFELLQEAQVVGVEQADVFDART